MLDKIPVYSDGRPIVTQQQKSEMEFCEQICTKDDDCISFHYDLLSTGQYGSCQTWTTNAYTGDGSDDKICFAKKARGKYSRNINRIFSNGSDYIKIIKEQSYCVNHVYLSKDEDSLEQCVAKVGNDDRCSNGKGHFFYR